MCDQQEVLSSSAAAKNATCDKTVCPGYGKVTAVNGSLANTLKNCMGGEQKGGRETPVTRYRGPRGLGSVAPEIFYWIPSPSSPSRNPPGCLFLARHSRSCGAHAYGSHSSPMGAIGR
jgi:hypothetical protein